MTRDLVQWLSVVMALVAYAAIVTALIRYGCISPGGVAVTDHPERIPFFEVPADSVRWVL